MITTLTDTTASAIDKKMIEMRETYGVTTLSRVLTLLVVAQDDDLDAAVDAAAHASHEHPCRVIVLIMDADADTDGLDAEIRLGRDAGAGEIIVLRARGGVVSALDTLVMPLLLPDAPIVTWWPGTAPSSPSHDVLGAMSQRRITDVARRPEGVAALKRLRRGYASGDSDLSWARLTRWRGILASLLEVPPISDPVMVSLTGDESDPAVVLLGAWFRTQLPDAQLEVLPADGTQPADCGLCGVKIHRAQDWLSLHRIDEDTVELTHSGDTASQHVTMPPRSLNELLAEELRRLDPDEVYGEVLAEAFAGIDDAAVYAQDKPAPVDEILADAQSVATSAAQRAAEVLVQALEDRPLAHLVLTGGTVGTRTAAALPQALKGAGADLSRLHLWWGDERFVPSGSEDRNDEQVREDCLEPLVRAGLPTENIHHVPCPADGMSLERAAAWYGQQLDAAGGDQPFHTHGAAFFDVLMLGVGPDAHIASLFPEHPAQRDTGGTAIPVTGSPKPPAERVSLSWPVVNSARHVQLLVAGEDKAEAVARAHGPIDPWNVPASAVRGLESTTWFLDEKAAGSLQRS